ncbi:MAG: heme NO-binding domain-containing protein [Bryobacteraceae bacterium]|nr:heme NO-binding domain-containing protein [Bryobacteraceae bacterium]
MKGMVFTEFLEMVEQKFDPETVDTIIENSNLPSGGAYTSVGTYDHQEMIELVGQLSAMTGIAAADLIRTFGKHLFGRFAVNYPVFFEGIHSTLAFLPNIDSYVHVEVLKLYPDAELPSFECRFDELDSFEMIYRSKHPFPDLAEGLIQGCIEHFGDSMDVKREDFNDASGPGSRFLISRSRS